MSEEGNLKYKKALELLSRFQLHGQGANSSDRITEAIELIEQLSDEELLFAHGMCYKGQGVSEKYESIFATAKETIRAGIELRYAKANLEQTSRLTSATAQLEIAINQMSEANQINRKQIEEQKRLWQESKIEADRLSREKENRKTFVRNLIVAIIGVIVGSFLTFMLTQKLEKMKQTQKMEVQQIDSIK